MRIQCGLGFAKAVFWGKDFAKPRLLIFEIRREFVLGFRAQEGSGEECALPKNTNAKYFYIVSVISLLCILSKSKGDAPSASASGISAMATRA